MNPLKRRTVIAGNWKMNFTPAEATAFINEIKPMVAGKDNCDIIFCAPYVTIAAAQEAAKGSNIKIGAENVHFAEKGAYTGEGYQFLSLTSMGRCPGSPCTSRTSPSSRGRLSCPSTEMST